MMNPQHSMNQMSLASSSTRRSNDDGENESMTLLQSLFVPGSNMRMHRLVCMALVVWSCLSMLGLLGGPHDTRQATTVANKDVMDEQGGTFSCSSLSDKRRPKEATMKTYTDSRFLLFFLLRFSNNRFSGCFN